MSGQLGQTEFDELSAYLDGELDEQRAAEVRRRIESDPAWRETHRQLTALDAALSVYSVPPAPQGLPERILQNVRREAEQPLVIRLVRWGAAVAAAAAIVLAAGLVVRQAAEKPGPSPNPGTARVEPAEAIPAEDVENLARDNLDFFQNLDVLSNLDTLEEIERLEQESEDSGT